MRDFLKKYNWFQTKHSILFALIGGIVIYSVFFVTSWGRLDPDFGWHLATGQYILNHGVPHYDIFTFTAKGHIWINHEWGNDVFLALIYKIGGYLLSSFFYALLWTGALLLIGWRKKTWILLVAALAIAPYAGIRPIAWSAFFFALTLRTLWSKNKNWRLVMPVIFLVWANLHAGFIAGLALIIYFAVMELDLGLIMLLFLIGGLTLINPFGTGLYVEIAQTIFDPNIHNQIAEWRSFYILTPSKPYIYLWVIGFLVFARPKWRRFISLGPLLFITGLVASRNIPLFVIATVGDLDAYVTTALQKAKKFKLNILSKLTVSVSLALAILVLIYVVSVALLPIQSRFNNYPVKEVAYLKRHQCTGNLFNDYNYGGYLIWKLPHTPDYIDGRMVTWVNHMNNYLKVVEQPSKYYLTQFNKYNIKCALLSLPADGKLKTVLNRSGWKTIMTSENGATLIETP